MFKLKLTLDRHNAKLKLNYWLLSDPSHFSLLSTFKKNHKFVNLFRLVQKVYVHTELMLVTNDPKICQEIHEHCTERKIRGKVFMKFTSHSSTDVFLISWQCAVVQYVYGARLSSLPTATTRSFEGTYKLIHCLQLYYNYMGKICSWYSIYGVHS